MRQLLTYLTAVFLLFTNEYAMSENDKISRYYLKVHIEGAFSEIKLNDIPVIKNIYNEGLVTTVPANLWLKNGINILSFIIFPDSDTENYKPRLTASLFLHDNKSDFPSPLTTLAEVEFSDEFDNQDPVSNKVQFKISDAPSLNLWADAEKITSLSNSDKESILDLTNSLQKAILSDTEKAIQLQEYKIKEDAIADAKTFTRLSEVAKENYDWLRSQDNLKANDVTIEQVTFQICGNGYLVDLTKNDKSDAIAIESETMYFEVPLFFAKIDGNWVIAR